MARAADKGDLFERQVARVLHAEGAFARRRVILEPFFGERFTVTDLDVLAFEFNAALTPTITIHECKTTESRSAPSAADRLLWLAGLRRLVGADGAVLVTSRAVSDHLRRLASDLGCSIADERDVEHREALLGLTATGGFASHDPGMAELEASALAALRKDQELQRAYWFARSDLWLARPVVALKRSLGGCRVVGERYSERLPEPEERALRWLSGELVTGVALAVTRLAAGSYQQPETVFDRQLAERLAEGIADYRSLEEMSKAVDEYLAGVLRESGARPGLLVSSLGAFSPRPPAYTERLVEVIHRFGTQPLAAAETARLADQLFAADLLPADQTRLDVAHRSEAGRLLRILAAFIERQTRMPSRLLAPIATPSSETSDPESGLPRDPAPRATPEDVPQQEPSSSSGETPPTLFGES